MSQDFGLPWEDHQDRLPRYSNIVCDYCDKCFELGEDYITSEVGNSHEDCWDDFVWAKVNAKRDVAGS
ncbi:hypothetical protein D3C79_1116550 [compost metagenome]